jgi:hypothetical protein
LRAHFAGLSSERLIPPRIRVKGKRVTLVTWEEAETWRHSGSQFAILIRGLNIKYLPLAFTSDDSCGPPWEKRSIGKVAGSEAGAKGKTLGAGEQPAAVRQQYAPAMPRAIKGVDPDPEPNGSGALVCPQVGL